MHRLFTTSLGANPAKELPKRFLLFAWGRNETTKGDFVVNATTISELPKNQDAVNFDTLTLDFEHQSVPGHDNWKDDPKDVAAHFVPEVVEGEGLYANNVVWTEAGEKYAGNYKDLSPVPAKNKKDEVIFLHSAALCQHGATRGLHFLSTTMESLNTGKGNEGENTGGAVRREIARLEKSGWSLKDLGNALNRSSGVIGAIKSGEIKNPPNDLLAAIRKLKPKTKALAAESEDFWRLESVARTMANLKNELKRLKKSGALSDMFEEISGKLDSLNNEFLTALDTGANQQIREQLIRILQLDEESADDDDITKALAALELEEDIDMTKEELTAVVQQAIAPLSAEVKAQSATITGYKAAIETQAGEITALKAEREKAAQNVLVQRAVAEGKAVPDELLTLSNEQLEKVIATLPVTVPLNQRTPEGVNPEPSPLTEGDAGVAAMLRGQLGVKEEKPADKKD